MTSKKQEKITFFKYIEHILTLASSVTLCVSISNYTSLLGVLIGIMSSAVELKICAITTVIAKFKSIVKKKEKKHDN